MKAALLIALVATAANAGDCWKELDASSVGGHLQLAIVYSSTCKPGNLTSVNVSSREFPVREVSEPLHLIVLDTPAGETQSLVERLRRQSTATITAAGITEKAPVVVRGFGDWRAYSIAIGPTSRPDQNAMRFKGNYLYEHRRGEVRGPAARAEINLDTTDEGDGFVDDNYVSLSGGYSGARFGDVLRRGFAGARLRYAKAFHSGNDDLDTMATVSGNIPLVQAFTIGGGPFAAPPLSVELNYGYRQNHGAVFEGTLTHHVFFGGRYWLAASGTFTVNEHKTQRLYRVAVSQFDEKDSRVTLVTTFEDGSVRAILKKVRQYFIGLGWQFGQ